MKKYVIVFTLLLFIATVILLLRKNTVPSLAQNACVTGDTNNDRSVGMDDYESWRRAYASLGN